MRKSKEHKKFIKDLYGKKDPNAVIGIYKIATSDSDFYIGSSTDINKRWIVHVYELKHNCHGNYRLQNLWNTLGEQSFIFSVIWKSTVKPMDRNKLYQVEQDFIDEHKPTLNIELTVSMKKERPKKGSIKRLPCVEPKRQEAYVPKKQKEPVKELTMEEAKVKIEKALVILNRPPLKGGIRKRRKSHGVSDYEKSLRKKKSR